eukprot:1156421-Pelagomonas_calceolata.AAC.3
MAKQASMGDNAGQHWFQLYKHDHEDEIECDADGSKTMVSCVKDAVRCTSLKTNAICNRSFKSTKGAGAQANHERITNLLLLTQ